MPLTCPRGIRGIMKPEIADRKEIEKIIEIYGNIISYSRWFVEC